MLTFLRISFATLVIIISVYAFIYDNFKVIPLIQFLLACMLVVTGLSELKQDRKKSAIVHFAITIFILLVFVKLILR